MKTRFLRAASWFVCFSFSLTSLNPVSFAMTPEVSSVPFKTLAIPAEFGQVTDRLAGSPGAPAFIHIQSAHGNYAAEKNIENLLGFIEKHSKVRTVLLEGAASKLQPELFRLFPKNPGFNRKVTDKLMQEGYLTGPESFLVGSTQKSEGWGIEDLNAYKKDRDAFIKVVQADTQTQKFLMARRADLSKSFASKLNKDLLTFVRQGDAFDSETLSFEAWLKVLEAASAKHLRMDLADTFNQVEWPFLVRYERLHAIGSRIDSQKARAEAQSFLKELEKRKISQEIISSFKTLLAKPEAELFKAAGKSANSYSPLRLAFDKAFGKLPKDFSMKAWPNWTLYAQYAILTQELEGKGLHEEVARLKEKILDVLAQTSDEKEYVAQTRELNLLRKLFTLELTRSEYEELNSRMTDGGRRMANNARPAPSTILHPLSGEISVVYQSAMDFYATAIVRENKMFANALAKMNEKKEKNAVIVTGGFHAEGLKKLAASQGCAYMQITPRIDEISKRDHEVYLRSILGARDFESSQMSALLALDQASMGQVLGAKLSSWLASVRELIKGLINSAPVLDRPALSAALSNSSLLGNAAAARSEVRGNGYGVLEQKVLEILGDINSGTSSSISLDQAKATAKKEIRKLSPEIGVIRSAFKFSSDLVVSVGNGTLAGNEEVLIARKEVLQDLLGEMSKADLRQASAPEVAAARSEMREENGKEEKMIYFFGANLTEGAVDMKDLLGGKGANLAKMAGLGLPVPPGFTITTDMTKQYFRNGNQFPEGLEHQVDVYMRRLENARRKKFGDASDPLLVSVRSGAKFSMPGMMDTILNVGLNDVSVEGLAAKTGDRRFAYDSYRRLLQMYGETAMGARRDALTKVFDDAKKAKGLGASEDHLLTAEDLEGMIPALKAVIAEETGREFPQDPKEQLMGAIEAVFRSSNNKQANDYRRANRIPMDIVSAVNVQSMVFGNLGDRSATGVLFSRDTASGAARVNGEFLINAQGEDVVAGIRAGSQIEQLKDFSEKLYRELMGYVELLEQDARDAQDMEFTIENGELFMLQTRDAKRTAKAMVRMAVEMAEEGLITKEEALMRIDIPRVEKELMHRMVDPKAAKKATKLAKGVDASPGVGVGQVVFDSERAEEMAKENPSAQLILVRDETSPEDLGGMLVSKGILTHLGGNTSHAALVARGQGIPAVVGVKELEIDFAAKTMRVGDHEFKEGDWITVDGSSGNVYAGQVPTLPSEIEQVQNGNMKPEDSPIYGYYAKLLDWAHEIRRLGVWANADTPEDARKARRLGAEGIGLTRTEHMFADPKRVPVVQAMFLSKEGSEERDEILREIGALQKGDFEGILAAMKGFPVTIRLLDPPMHEFLPKVTDTERINWLANRLGITPEQVIQRINKAHEANPMLGNRGVRLGLLNPSIMKMQVRAMVQAYVSNLKKGIKTSLKIMVPNVSVANEFLAAKKIIAEEMTEVLDEAGIPQKERDIEIGVMIETPAAALRSGKIAEHADFFSFGTNDLTQGTFMFSRDDAALSFLPVYIEQKILKHDPTQVLDADSVLRLVATSVQEGREKKPWLSIGVCGEHGGEPESVGLFDRAGLTYVSASPLRVPVSILASAQSNIRLSKEREEAAKAGKEIAGIKPIAKITVRSEVRKISAAGLLQAGATVASVITQGEAASARSETREGIKVTGKELADAIIGVANQEHNRNLNTSTSMPSGWGAMFSGMDLDSYYAAAGLLKKDQIYTRAEVSKLMNKHDVATYVQDRVFTAFNLLEKKKIKQESLQIYAQHFSLKTGAATGSVSSHLVEEVGAQASLVGHSERRTRLIEIYDMDKNSSTFGKLLRTEQQYGDSDKAINQKLKAAARGEVVKQLLCMGEPRSVREQGDDAAIQFVLGQLTKAFKGMREQDIRNALKDNRIAYEPIWAINTGLTATPEQAQTMHHAIRQWLAKTYSPKLANEMTILYGGSAKPDNVEKLLSQMDIDGFLVGGASLKLESFAKMGQLMAGIDKGNGRKPILAANWKAMPKAERTDLKEFVSGLARQEFLREGKVGVIVAPPHTLIERAVQARDAGARSELRAEVLPEATWIEVAQAEAQIKRAFGTNGIRADDIGIDGQRRIAAGTADELAAQWRATHANEELPQVVVGFDPRPQGNKGFNLAEMSESKAVAEVFAAYGFKVVFVPRAVAAPFMIAASGSKNIYAAIMRTASHNEVVDPKSGKLVSGFKLFMENAPAGDDFTGRISAKINDPEFSVEVPRYDFDEAVTAGRIIVSEVGDRYDPDTIELWRMDKSFDFPAIGKKLLSKFPGYKIALNTMHGGMSSFGPRVLKAMGLVKDKNFWAFNTTLMNDPSMKSKMTGWVEYQDPKTGATKKVRFAPDPTRASMRGQEYQDFVAQDPMKTLALLIDGDADRLVAELGKEIIPNEIGMLAAYYLAKYKGQKGRIVRTVPTTGGLDALAQALELGKVDVTPVGSKWFKGPNKYFDGSLTDVLVAVEESGHIVFNKKGQLFFDHSIGLATLMLEMMAETGKTWQELSDEMWAFIKEKTGQERIATVRDGISKDEGAENYYPLVSRLGNPAEKDFRREFAGKMEAALAKAGLPWKVTNMDITDAGGAQLQFEGGRKVFPRKSGTDGSVRLYVEVLETEREQVPLLIKSMREVMDSFVSAQRSEVRKTYSAQAALGISLAGKALSTETLNILDGKAANAGAMQTVIGGIPSVASQEALNAKNLSIKTREEEVIMSTLPSAASKDRVVSKRSEVRLNNENFKPVNVPEGLVPAVEHYGLKATKVEILSLSGEAVPEDLLSDKLASFAVGSSIAQAFGSQPFTGLGKDVKEVADGNAVHFTERSLEYYTKQNAKTAVVVLGDEGARDGSFSLAIGTLYVDGKKMSLELKSHLYEMLKDLRDEGYQILYFVGDALEHTNGLYRPEALKAPSDSNSLFSFFIEGPGARLNGKDRFFISDFSRIGGTSFSSPTSVTVSPFDLPSVALPKIAKARGEDIATFMNHAIVVTLGPRASEDRKAYETSLSKHRHQAIIKDMNALKVQYPGLTVVTPGDGDLLPRIVAELGLDLDGKHMVVFGRSGAAEATAATIVAAALKNARFSHTFVSPKATGNNFSAATAYQYSGAEVESFKELSIPADIYNQPRGKRDVKGKGMAAFTSVTGASEGLFGKAFSSVFQRLTFTDLDGNKGQAVANTLFVKEGAAFIVRTTLRTEDLKTTQSGLAWASHAAREYWREKESARSEVRLADAKIKAREIKDSRGKSTVQVELTLGDITVTGDVPAGASKGEDEAATVSTQQAIQNINKTIVPLIKLSGLDLRKHEDLRKLEALIVQAAGDNFKTLGANATVPMSWALWNMAAELKDMSLAQYIRTFEPGSVYQNPEPVRFLMNIFNGGLHALKAGETLGVDRIDIQEIMIVPVSAKSYREALAMGDKVDAALKKILLAKFDADKITRADEAGFSVKGLGNSTEAIEYVFQAIEAAGYQVGKDVQLALDVAASSFFKDGKYEFQGQKIDSAAMVEYYAGLVEKYGTKIRSIEDGLAENDWKGWVSLTGKMTEKGVTTIGDDLYVTQLGRLNKGIEMGAATAILIKVNQNGTVSGTLDTIKQAKANGVKAVVSHRSGETISANIADLAVGVNAWGLKTGDPQPAYDFGPGGAYAGKELVRRSKYLRMSDLESYADFDVVPVEWKRDPAPILTGRSELRASLPQMLNNLNVSIKGVTGTAKNVTAGLYARTILATASARTALLEMAADPSERSEIAKKSIATAMMLLGLRGATDSDVFVLSPEFVKKDLRAAAGMRKLYGQATLMAIVTTPAEQGLLEALNKNFAKEGLQPIAAVDAKDVAAFKARLGRIRNAVVRPVLLGGEVLPAALLKLLDKNQIVVTEGMYNRFVNAVDMLVADLVSGLQAKAAMGRSA